MSICKSAGCRARAQEGDLCRLHAFAHRRAAGACAVPRSEEAERLRQIVRRKAAALGLALDESAAAVKPTGAAKGRRPRPPMA